LSRDITGRSSIGVSGVFLEHPLDIPDLFLQPLGGYGAAGLHLRGEDRYPVLLHHPSVLFQCLLQLIGGGGDLPRYLLQDKTGGGSPYLFINMGTTAPFI